MMSLKWFTRSLCMAMLVWCSAVGLICAQEDQNSEKPAQVILEGKTLFVIEAGAGSYSAEERAKILKERMEYAAENRSVNIENIEIRKGSLGFDIVMDGKILHTVTAPDGETAKKPQMVLAKERSEIIRASLLEYRRQRTVKSLVIDGILAVVLTIALLVALRIFRFIRAKVQGRVAALKEGRFYRAIHVQRLELLTPDQLKPFMLRVEKAFAYGVYALVFYFYLYALLDRTPWTRPYADQLLGYILGPVKAVGRGLVQYLPSLFAIVVLCLLAYYVLKVVRFFFDQLRKGALRFEWFDEDWVDPSYKIARFFLIALTAVIIFPYLPGSESPAFKGLSIFFGVLFSLGSSSAVSNVIAGIVLTYTRAFKIGDRIKIGDNTGDVLETSLLVTRISTIKNEKVTIPNATVLGSHIVNYTEMAKKSKGLILHTTVTIGYDAPWRVVHSLLVKAALSTDHVLKEPPPFVLQTSLDDFYVSYEINAYTVNPEFMASIYSQLHQNIQDAFNEGGVEIMSPHFRQLRDGNQTTIPGDYLPPDYVAPSFSVRVKEGGEKTSEPKERL